jgi:hypothetical protein
MSWGGTCRIGSAKMLGNIVDIYAHNNNKQASKQANKQTKTVDTKHTSCGICCATASV